MSGSYLQVVSHFVSHVTITLLASLGAICGHDSTVSLTAERRERCADTLR